MTSPPLPLSPGPTDPGADLAGARAGVSSLRRKLGEASLLKFARAYLPGYFKHASSSMHAEIAALLQQADRQRGVRLAIAAPRNHAKSTLVSLAYVLWCVVYSREPYILLISNTAEQAEELLTHVKTELANNPYLREDFPACCEQGPKPSRWARDEIVTRSGVKVAALGADKKIRGRRFSQHRPSLIILDDVENDQEVRSPEQRQSKLEWLMKSVLKAGHGTTNVVVVGTILHYDSLLARLVNPGLSPGWDGRKYQAVLGWSKHPELWQAWEGIYCRREEHEGQSGPAGATAFFKAHEAEMLEGTHVLWPEMEGYLQLMEMRLREGRAAFDSEKQNQPLNPDECLFREEDIQYWDDLHPSEEDLIRSIEAAGHGWLMFGACDPSLGRKGRNADDSAIVTLLRDGTTGVLYVLDADIRRRMPDGIIEDIIAYHGRRKYARLGFEANMFQEVLAGQLTERSRAGGSEVPVEPIKNHTDKVARIQKLQPLVTSGGIRFCRRHSLLLDQLRQFPLGAHDDGPDALEMAVSTAALGSNGFYCMVVEVGRSQDVDEDDWGWTRIDGPTGIFGMDARRW